MYFPGGAVQAGAYASLAFQIAARGWVVVIPTVQLRVATLGLAAASAIIARYCARASARENVYFLGHWLRFKLA